MEYVVDTLLKYEMVSFQLSNSNPLISTTPFTISQKWEPHCVVLVLLLWLLSYGCIIA